MMMRNHGQESAHNNGDHVHAQRVQRRTSKGRESDRHGRIYDHQVEGTIRTVTPEAAEPENLEITALPSPTSHPSYVPGWDPTASVSNTDEEGLAGGRQRKVKKKSKRRDDTQSDASPTSFLGKTRKRLGSITTSASFTARPEEQPVGSIGYPSVVQTSVFPDFGEARQPTPRTPKTALSTESNPGASSASLRSPLLLDKDSNRILQLMKTTCGRMHGILFYRPVGTASWNSGYCAINVGPGSLVCQAKGDVTTVKVLVPDLRGCTVRTRYDATSQSTYLSVVLPASGFGFQLRPPVPETFDSWLAALLCWQPLRPKGIHNKMAKLQPVLMADRKQADQRRTSDAVHARSTAIVKVGQMMLWYGPLPDGSQRTHPAHSTEFGSEDHSLWRRVSCTLHESGTFKLFCEETAQPVSTVRLSSLARSSVQRFDESVLDAEHCLAIFPQYTVQSREPTTARPLVLRLDSRVAYEAWFVLLRALTVPELYGPKTSDNSAIPEHRDTVDGRGLTRDMFRVERALSIRIVEAKFSKRMSDTADQHVQSVRGQPLSPEKKDVDLYADVILGRDLRARTSMKSCSKSAFWAEEFNLEDLPSVLSRISVIVKFGNLAETEWTMITKEGYELPASDDVHEMDGIEVASHDPVCGRVDIPISDLEQEKTIEKRWSLVDNDGRSIGQLLMKMSLSENVVLLESEYDRLSTLLHRFDNSLTTQIAQVLGTELKQLSDLLLDIFQVTDSVEEWINNLIEEEIDGIYRETPPVRMRFSSRIHSNDSYESAEHRELLVRDLSRSATMEANLLFRGNSLVTKALDAHMRRIGRNYLAQTLGDVLRSVVSKDPNCEVDPTRIKSNDQKERNWTNLINVTSSVWKAIATSASACPPGMRTILKHIRSCAEDRYGSFIRTVKYTSVSGFLFLRFFCPAILNPQLFGLIDELPAERPRRTFTLIAKSLIVLANMSKFGQKEPWMEPMNKFLTTATTEFKDFIEQVCSYDASAPSKFIDPQYQAPIQVKARLPRLSREGLPSLPYLLDSAKLHATLAETWLDLAPENIVDTGIDDCLQEFHRICLGLRQRARDSMVKAESAEEPDGTLEQQWQQILRKNQRSKAHSDMHDGQMDGLAADVENVAFSSPIGERATNDSSISVDNAGQWANRDPSLSSPAAALAVRSRWASSAGQRHGDYNPMMNSMNSSTASVDRTEDRKARPLPSSRDGSSRKKVFDSASKRRGNNNEAGERMYESYEEGDV